MNQLGGVGAGGIPGRSYMFASNADGVHKLSYCGKQAPRNFKQFYYLIKNKYILKV